MRKILLSTMLIVPMILGACGESSSKIDMNNPNTWDKKSYLKSEEIVKQNFNNFVSNATTNTEPSSIAYGEIKEMIYTPTDDKGNYNVVLYVNTLTRFDEKTLDIIGGTYEEYNKALIEAVNKKEDGESIELDIHLPYNTSVILYIFTFDKNGKLIDSYYK